MKILFPGREISFAIAALVFPHALRAQDSPKPLRFEVASVRRVMLSDEERLADFHRFQAEVKTNRLTALRSAPLVIRGARVDMDGIVMRELIAAAYGEPPEQITAPDMPGSGRLGQIRYVIHAIMPEGSTKAQLPGMLRALLEERFQLKVRRAAVEQPAYALTLKKGAELRPARELDRASCEGWVSDSSFPGAEMCMGLRTIGGKSVAVTMRSDSRFGPWESHLENNSHRTEFFSVTMPQLARYLTAKLSIIGFMGRDVLLPVVDGTGLDGFYDIVLEGTPSDPTNMALWNPEGEGGPAGEFGSALGKIGLKLDKTKASVEQLVIDHVEMQPTEN